MHLQHNLYHTLSLTKLKVQDLMIKHPIVAEFSVILSQNSALGCLEIIVYFVFAVFFFGFSVVFFFVGMRGFRGDFCSFFFIFDG